MRVIPGGVPGGVPARTVPAPLRIGPVTVDPPVVLAPMAGVTNPAYRQLCAEFGAPLCVTEMTTARALVEGNERTWRMVRRPPGARHHSVQLYGVDPAVVGRAVELLVGEAGVDHVDLNFGCPAAKVTRNGGGAALPVHHVLFGRIVAAAVAAAATVPVTVKMRMGIDDSHRTDLTAGRIAADAGAAAVALHARTAHQLYSGHARWEAIAALKETVTSVPVLGNGDLWEADDAVAMLARTGCDAVVVGRGCLGRPWLFDDLRRVLAGGTGRPVPTLGEVVAVMRRHLDLLATHLGEARAARDFRKHVGWYLAGYPVGRPARRTLTSREHVADTDAALARLLTTVDPRTTVDRAVAAAPRGHTNGPRPVALPTGWLDSVDDPTPPSGPDASCSGG